MKKIFQKKLGLKIALLSIVVGLVGLVFSSYQTYAANITAGVLNISFAGDQLFSETNLAPGDEVVKDLTVTNTGTVPHSFSIAASGVSGGLADVLQIEPRDGGVAIWNETLTSLASLSNGSKVIIPSIPAGGSKTIQIAAILPTSIGNAYQGTSTPSFDFVTGYESTDQLEPTSNPSPPPTLGTTGATTVGNFSSQTGDSGVADEGITDEEQSLDLNGEVAGEENGEALGVETEEMPICFWWWVLLAVFAIFLTISGYRNRDKKHIIIWSCPIISAMALYAIHWILHDYYTPSNMCPYFVWFELLGLVLYGVGVYISRSQEIKK